MSIHEYLETRRYLWHDLAECLSTGLDVPLAAYVTGWLKLYATPDMAAALDQYFCARVKALALEFSASRDDAYRDISNAAGVGLSALTRHRLDVAGREWSVLEPIATDFLRIFAITQESAFNQLIRQEGERDA